MQIIQFKYQNEIIAQQSADLSIDKVMELKNSLAKIFQCESEDIETINIDKWGEGIEPSTYYSQFDVSDKGIFKWNSSYGDDEVICKVSSNVDESSDEFLDAIMGVNVENFIEKHLVLSF